MDYILHWDKNTLHYLSRALRQNSKYPTWNPSTIVQVPNREIASPNQRLATPTMKFPSTPPLPVSPHHRSTDGFYQSSQSAGEPHTSISKVTSIALNPVLKKKLFYDTVVTKEVVEKSMAIISFKFKHPLSSMCVLVCIWL